ncbi:MAG: hypothetical protein ABSD39_03145 [Terriglobales bacterium]
MPNLASPQENSERALNPMTARHLRDVQLATPEKSAEILNSILMGIASLIFEQLRPNPQDFEDNLEEPITYSQRF